MKPRTRQARLALRDAQNREWRLRWLPADQVFVAKRPRYPEEYVVTAAEMCALFVPQETPLFREEVA